VRFLTGGYKARKTSGARSPARAGHALDRRRGRARAWRHGPRHAKVIVSADRPAPLKVFISHIHEERALGEVIKRCIEDAFPDRVAAFLSSDRRDLPAGRKWREVILAELETARVIVSLLSPVSLARPWVNVELGAAWIKDLPIIPLCHSGQTIGALPPPFADYHGAGLDQPDAAERLLGGIANALGLRLPRLHFEAFVQEMIAAAARSEGRPGDLPPVAAGELPPEQEAILVALARWENTGHEDVERGLLPKMTGLQPAALTYHFSQLVDADLITVSHYGGGDHYSLRPNGSEWLLARGKMPE
jgi:hypothetical protein